MIPFLRNLVLNDFWLKLFSLGLASLIWFTVNMMRSSNTPVRTLTRPVMERSVFYNVPVVVMSSAEDVRNFQVSPKEIDITVQGEEQALQNLQKKDIRAIVDLSGIEGEGDLKKRIEVSTPPGVTHIKVVPPEVQVIFPPKSG